MKEEIDKWAKNKAKEWVFNLRKGLSEKRKILGYDGFHYILEKAFKTGYQKALEDIGKNG